MQLHDYQIRAVDFALQQKCSYMMVDRGLGKTAIALKAIEFSGLPALVFAPMRVCYNTWPEEIKLWTPSLTYTILHGKNKNDNLRLDRRIYLLNYEGIKWFYHACCNKKFRLRKFFTVFDESSMLKNPSTRRFKWLKKMTSIFGQRMDLSATPRPNGLHELWPQYYMLDDGRRLGKYFGHFANTYFIYSGPPQFKYWPKKGAEKAMYSKVHDVTFRLKDSDYLKMPPITYNEVRISFTPKQQKEYERIEKQYLLEIGGQLVPIDSDAGSISKAHQFVQGAVYKDAKKGTYEVKHKLKINALKEIIDTSAGQPILCAIWYKFEYDMICDALDYKIPTIAGRTSAKESNLYIKRWNKGELPLLLVQPQSVQFGLNLQAGGHILLWYTLTWSLESYMQLVGRLYRQGQKRGVIVHHLAIQNTIDKVFLRVLKNKDSSQDDMLEAMKTYMHRKYVR